MAKQSIRNKPAAIDARDVCEDLCFDASLVSALRKSAFSLETIFRMADIFQVLSDPTRLRIIDFLARGELCVCDLAHLLGMSLSAVSHQLRRLRDIRLVKYRYAGRMAFYSLDNQLVRTLLASAARQVEKQ